jgi:hypothetical protein
MLITSIEIHKVLTKISKDKDCSDLKEWIGPCGNHFLWSATTTLSGDGNVIWAKFKSFFPMLQTNIKTYLIHYLINVPMMMTLQKESG